MSLVSLLMTESFVSKMVYPEVRTGVGVSEVSGLGGALRNIEGDFLNSALGRGLSCNGGVVGIGVAGSLGVDEPEPLDLGGGRCGKEGEFGMPGLGLELRVSLRGTRVNKPFASWVCGEVVTLG